ncbi:MAG: hypothetical protein F9K43_05020 [Bauldia sp.]|nr:MAG: hypothetical protein F9K43_05020 [Bauldia sp.]MBZ0229320.1 hypothetical protein [Bauldia sp.]
MWRFLDRLFAVIGVVATVAGTAVTVYAFYYPNEVGSVIEKVLDRMAKEPVLDASDRFAVEGFFDDMVSIGKQPTTDQGSMEVVICQDGAAAPLLNTVVGFGRSEDSFLFAGLDFRGNPTIVTMNVKTPGAAFSRRERWQKMGSSWTRALPPDIGNTAQVGCA